MSEEQLIQKGFNHGYQLQKHDPQLAENLAKGWQDQNHPYSQAFAAGRQEFSKEKALENFNPSLPTKDKGHSQEKGLDI